MNNNRPDHSRQIDKRYNNLVIAIGIVVSIFAFSFIAHEPGISPDTARAEAFVQVHNNSISPDRKILKTGHNFLAVYFLQGSAIERKTSEPENGKLTTKGFAHLRNAVVNLVNTIL